MTIGGDVQPGADGVAEADQKLHEQGHRIGFGVRLNEPDHLAGQAVQDARRQRLGPLGKADRDDLSRLVVVWLVLVFVVLVGWVSRLARRNPPCPGGLRFAYPPYQVDSTLPTAHRTLGLEVLHPQSQGRHDRLRWAGWLPGVVPATTFQAHSPTRDGFHEESWQISTMNRAACLMASRSQRRRAAGRFQLADDQLQWCHFQ